MLSAGKIWIFFSSPVLIVIVFGWLVVVLAMQLSPWPWPWPGTLGSHSLWWFHACIGRPGGEIKITQIMLYLGTKKVFWIRQVVSSVDCSCGREVQDRVSCWVFLYNFSFFHLQLGAAGCWVRKSCCSTQIFKNSVYGATSNISLRSDKLSPEYLDPGVNEQGMEMRSRRSQPESLKNINPPYHRLKRIPDR